MVHSLILNCSLRCQARTNQLVSRSLEPSPDLSIKAFWRGKWSCTSSTKLQCCYDVIHTSLKSMRLLRGALPVPQQRTCSLPTTFASPFELLLLHTRITGLTCNI
jgi:hypothetical protein